MIRHQEEEHSHCGQLHFRCRLVYCCFVNVVVFVDLRAMLAHLERRLSAIPWAAGRQARSQPAGKLCPLNLPRLPLSVSN